MDSKLARSGLDAYWLLRFVLGAGLGALTVYASNQFAANYRAGEGVLLLVASAALGAWSRGNWRAFGLGMLLVVGIALAYLAVLMVIVVLISASGGSIS